MFAIDPYEWKREQALKFGATQAFADIASAAASIAESTSGLMCHKVIVAVGRSEGREVETWMQLTAKGGVCVVTAMGSVMATDVTLNLAGCRRCRKVCREVCSAAATRSTTSPRFTRSSRSTTAIAT